MARMGHPRSLAQSLPQPLPVPSARWAASIPDLTPVAPALVLQTPRRSEFRRVHHFHTMPSAPRLLAWNDPSRTGDHAATSRYASAFSLQFDHLARVIGVVPAHYFLGAAVGVLFWFGVRQGIHSIMLGRRNLQRLGVERDMIDSLRPAGPQPLYLENLAYRNSAQRWQTRFFMAMDTSATVGAALVGIGTLFRHPLLGGLVHALVPVAVPLLTGAFVPLVLPSAIVVVERGVRTVRTVVRTHAMHRYLAQATDVPTEAAEEVETLYRDRQHELARYFVMDGVARAGLLAGATVSVFVGPGGLILLIPSAVCVIVSECFSRRILNVDDALPMEERLLLQTDEDFFNAILESHVDLESLKSLRALRGTAYPNGWGTLWRPLFRLFRHMRGQYEPNAEDSKDVLAAFSRRATELQPWPQPTPYELVELMDQGHVRMQFAAAVLNDKILRTAFEGQGFTREGRKWTLDADLMANTMAQMQGDPEQDQSAVDRVYEMAEEVLLTTGLTETFRRERALLDHYGRYVQTAERLATTRSDS